MAYVPGGDAFPAILIIENLWHHLHNSYIAIPDIFPQKSHGG